VYRLAAHQLRDRPIQEAAAYLELTARRQRAETLADRIQRLELVQPWSTRWAAWQSDIPHRILGRHTVAVNAVTVAEVGGRPVVVSGGSDAMVRVWELATGEPVGEPFTGHRGRVNAVAVAELAGRPVVVSGGGINDGIVGVWELHASQVCSIETDASVQAIVCLPSSRILVATTRGLALHQLVVRR
jgi:WD40 repeat protein